MFWKHGVTDTLQTILRITHSANMLVDLKILQAALGQMQHNLTCNVRKLF